MTSKLRDLKNQHIAAEVKTIDDKTKKNASDILRFSFYRGFFYYTQRSYLIYECKKISFSFTNNKIKLCKSTGIDNFSRRTDLDSVSDSKNILPDLKK